MFSLSKTLFQKTQEEERTKIKIYLILSALLLATISCIPSVYASVIYNQGSLRYLALITLIVNFGYGFYGYQNLIHYFYKNILSKYYDKDTKQETLLKRKLLLGIKKLMDSGIKIDFSTITPSQLIQLLLEYANRKNPEVKVMLQYFSGFLLAIVGGLVDVYLIKEFFMIAFSLNGFFAGIAALCCAIPGCVVSFIAAKNIVGKLYDIVTRKNSFNPLSQPYFSCGRYISVMIFLVSLLAPTAAANIVFHTFLQQGFQAEFLWIPVIIISLSRIIFSNFTLNNFVETFVFYLLARKNKTHPLRETRMKLILLKQHLVTFLQTETSSNLKKSLSADNP